MKVLVRFCLPNHWDSTVSPSGPWFYGLSTADGWVWRWPTADPTVGPGIWTQPSDGAIFRVTRPLPALAHPRLATIYTEILEIPAPPDGAIPLLFAQLYRTADGDEPAWGESEVWPVTEPPTQPCVTVHQYFGSSRTL